MTPEDDPHAVGEAYCGRCRDYFEDLAVAIVAHGGWCPRCDRPVNSERENQPGATEPARPEWRPRGRRR